jgi:acetylornithine deacetylase/succinyl-diaminopimelate desuccinylase-like protein
VRGKTAHVTQREQGRNAISAIAKSLTGLDESILSQRGSPLFEELPILNVGVVRGGNSASMLAGEATAELDLRWSSGMRPGVARQDIERHVRRAVGSQFGVEVTEIGRPKFYSPRPLEIDPDWQVVKAVANAHEQVVGSAALIGSWSPLVRYGSDAPHLLSAGIPTCVYGPGRAMDINAEREHILFSDVITAAEVYARAGVELLGGSRL